MIIDTESHVVYRVYPHEINPDVPRTFRLSWHEHDGDLFDAEMERAGVDYAFLISYDAEDQLRPFSLAGGTVEDAWGGKRYALAAVRNHPDRFIWFTTVKHPARSDSLDILNADLDLGAVGIKVFPTYMGVNAAHPGLMEMYRLCANRNRRVILSFEDTSAETLSVSQLFEELDCILEEFPSVRFQLNHGGAGNPDDRASDPRTSEGRRVLEVVERHDNIILSTAMLGKRWDDAHHYPFPNELERLEAVYRAVGPERICWASDWPWLEEHMMYPQAVDSVRLHTPFFTDEDREKYLGGNAWAFVEDTLAEYRSAPLFQA